MEYLSQTQARRVTGISYLTSLSATVKHKKSIKYGVLTCSLYLSPGNTSGYEVCPGRNAECSLVCLNESGMNTMTQKVKGDVINESRIKKTKLFFEHREFFMRWLISEIQSGITKAARKDLDFVIRLNNTSDISPEDFVIDGENILQKYPEIQFYDYTKVKERIELLKKYPNYDLTFSYNGYNWDICEQMLSQNIRVAVVFNKIPEEYKGYKVIDGDIHDLRYWHNSPVIVGLKYKRVRNQLNPNFKFVVQ